MKYQSTGNLSKEITRNKNEGFFMVTNNVQNNSSSYYTNTCSLNNTSDSQSTKSCDYSSTACLTTLSNVNLDQIGNSNTTAILMKIA
jgi:hypothetical protein